MSLYVPYNYIHSVFIVLDLCTYQQLLILESKTSRKMEEGKKVNTISNGASMDFNLFKVLLDIAA